jgi:hypothetical protein
LLDVQRVKVSWLKHLHMPASRNISEEINLSSYIFPRRIVILLFAPS